MCREKKDFFSKDVVLYVLLMLMTMRDVLLIQAQQITCATTSRGQFFIKFNELEEWMSEKNISEVVPIEVQYYTSSRKSLVTQLSNKKWLFRLHIFNIDIFEKYRFRLIGTSLQHQRETLEEFSFPNKKISKFNAWEQGFTLDKAKDCFKDPNSTYVVKATCKTLEILISDKNYVHKLTTPTLDKIFSVNGVLYLYNNTFDLTRFYKGDILQPGKSHAVCINIIMNWRNKTVCEKFVPTCDQRLKQRNITLTKSGPNNTTKILTVTFGIIIVLILLLIAGIIRKLKLYKKSTRCIYSSIANRISPRQPRPFISDRTDMQNRALPSPPSTPMRNLQGNRIPFHSPNHNYDNTLKVELDTIDPMESLDGKINAKDESKSIAET